MAACVAAAAPAVAQTQTERPTGGPFTGLFKGSPKSQPHTLDLQASGFAAWDDNLVNLAPGGSIGNALDAVDPRLLKQGVASGFQGSVNYGFHKGGTRSQFSLGGNASVQEFASALSADPFWFHSYGGSTSLTTKVTSKTSISFAGGAAYAPFYQYAPFLANTASEESPVGTDYGYAVNSAWVRSASASASVSNQFSKRSTISAGLSWDQRVIPANEDSSIDTRAISTRFSHSLTRKLAFYIGYGIQELRNGLEANGKPLRSNLLDVGLGYGDGLTLSLGRRTTLSLSGGASIMKNGDPALVAKTGKGTAFAIEGSAMLSRSIGRDWGASLGYARHTGYMVGFSDLITTDSANAGIGGPLTERLQFSAGAGASRGQQVFAVSTGSLVSYTASTRLSFALFSHLGLYGQASYYRFSIPADFNNFGFVPELNRRSVSVGLNTWLPLIKQRRARRDPGAPTGTGQP